MAYYKVPKEVQEVLARSGRKRCTRCMRDLPFEAFAKERQKKDGLKSWCRECHAAKRAERPWNARLTPEQIEVNRERARQWARNNRQRRQRNRDAYRERHPERFRAQMAVSYAISVGRLEPAPCEVCGASKTHAHHDDFGKPLEVRWLCPAHQGEAIARRRAQEARAGRSLHRLRATDIGALQIATLDAVGVDALIAAGETVVERKAAPPKGGLGSSVAAYANSGGGWMLIGVSNVGEPVGWRPPGRDEVHDWLRNHLRHAVDPLPTFDCKTVELAGKPVVALRIYPGSPPYVLRATGSVYVREPGGKHVIHTQAQLLDLVRRGTERVGALRSA